jgi:hypothetical protein
MIIENIISKELQDKLSEEITNGNFPWYYNNSTNYDQHGTEKDDGYQFVHTVFKDNNITSPVFELLKPILQSFEEHTSLKIVNILRIKINLLTPLKLSEEQIQNTIHTDIAKDSPFTSVVSLIYYVVDSDGDTVVYDDTDIITCTPKKGNAFYFNSIMDHRASNPIINKRRIVINFVMEIA